MRRLTFTPDRLVDGRVTFDRDESHHAAHVLRLRPGDTVVASSGDGVDCTIRLETVGDVTTGSVIARRARPTESPLRIELVQGAPKGDRMETIVRAGTELGVARFLPAITERTVVHLDGPRWRERARRWQRVAKEATKQCGRAIVPDVATPRPLPECLDDLGTPGADDLYLCLWEDATTPLDPVLLAAGAPARVVMLVGPEGGLADAEVEAARARGWRVASLGPRVLRTETAGPAVIAVVQARLGDLTRA